MIILNAIKNCQKQLKDDPTRFNEFKELVINNLITFISSTKFNSELMAFVPTHSFVFVHAKSDEL